MQIYASYFYLCNVIFIFLTEHFHHLIFCKKKIVKINGNWQEQLSYTPSAEKRTIVKTPKRSSLRTSILNNQRKKELAKIGEAKKDSLSIKANDIFITPFTRDKKATVFYKNLDTSCKKKLLHHIPIYTSTSFRKMSNTSNRTPFIAIKK